MFYYINIVYIIYQKVNKTLGRLRERMEKISQETNKDKKIKIELEKTTTSISNGLNNIFNHIDEQKKQIKKLEEELYTRESNNQVNNFEEVVEDRDRILKELFYLRKNSSKDFDIKKVEEMREIINTLEIKLNLSEERVANLIKEKEKYMKNLKLIENRITKVMKKLVNLVKNT